MGWGFEADCPDCEYHWDGVETNMRIGPWSWYGASLENGRSMFCPHCYRRLSYPRTLDRAAWKQWYELQLRDFNEKTACPVWLLRALERFDELFPKDRWYVPVPIDLGDVNCPGCNRQMVISDTGGQSVTCPQCESCRPRLTGFESHENLLPDEYGFA